MDETDIGLDPGYWYVIWVNIRIIQWWRRPDADVIVLPQLTYSAEDTQYEHLPSRSRLINGSLRNAYIAEHEIGNRTFLCLFVATSIRLYPWPFSLGWMHIPRIGSAKKRFTKSGFKEDNFSRLQLIKLLHGYQQDISRSNLHSELSVSSMPNQMAMCTVEITYVYAIVGRNNVKERKNKYVVKRYFLPCPWSCKGKWGFVLWSLNKGYARRILLL